MTSSPASSKYESKRTHDADYGLKIDLKLNDQTEKKSKCSPASLSPHEFSSSFDLSSHSKSLKNKTFTSSSSFKKAKLDNSCVTNSSCDRSESPNRIQYDDFNSTTKGRIEMCKDDPDLNNIECYLETDELWKKFHELGTEMIITKSGRRMFPPLRVSFSGSSLNQKYIVAMDIVPTDNKRYRYAYHRSSWLVAGKADPPVQSRLFVHPDGPFTGDALYKQIVSFEKVKLTNNEMDRCGHVIFNSYLYICFKLY
jgi:hypothetical protein